MSAPSPAPLGRRTIRPACSMMNRSSVPERLARPIGFDSVATNSSSTPTRSRATVGMVVVVVVVVVGPAVVVGRSLVVGTGSGVVVEGAGRTGVSSPGTGPFAVGSTGASSTPHADTTLIPITRSAIQRARLTHRVPTSVTARSYRTPRSAKGHQSGPPPLSANQRRLGAWHLIAFRGQAPKWIS